MRNKSLQLCGFTCIMGIFGAFLRWIQTITIFEPDTNLAAPHSPLSYTVILFILLGAILLFLLVRSLIKYSFPQNYPNVFARGITIYSVAATVIGVIMAVGGIITLIHAMSTTAKTSYFVFETLLGLLSIPCAACMTTFVLNANKPNKKSSGVFSAVILVVYLCYWLITAYKYSASDPVIWHFAPRLLAISATILALYFVAGFVFNKPRPLHSLYFNLLGAFLCIITLADSYPIGEQLIVLAFAILMLLLSSAQLNNMSLEETITESK